jgi:hypothetical protein
MSQEKVFADGFSFKRNENAPEFVVGRLSLKVDEAVAFMKENQKNGWVNISIKYGRSGNPYCELDMYEPTDMSKKQGQMSKNVGSMTKNVQPHVEKEEDELPF